MKPKYIVDACGTKYWYLHGKLHRVDGPAIEFASGAYQWCLDNHYHRVGGPAVEYTDGAKYWCINGLLHREDGPAVESADGTKCWYLHGTAYSFKDYITQLTDQDVIDRLMATHVLEGVI